MIPINFDGYNSKINYLRVENDVQWSIHFIPKSVSISLNQQWRYTTFRSLHSFTVAIDNMNSPERTDKPMQNKTKAEY